MKKVEVIIGIIFVTIGAIVFEMGQNYVEESINGGNIIKLLGLALLSAGVIIYIVLVDSIDEKKKKRE